MKCIICGNEIGKDKTTLELLGSDFWEQVQTYRKLQKTCIDCRREMLFAAIINPY